MSYIKKQENSNHYIFIVKSHLSRFDLIQGFLDNDYFKIRLITDNSEKAKTSMYSTLEKFESIRQFEFEINSSDPDYIKHKQKRLYSIEYYEKLFATQKKKDFEGKKAVIFLDDFLKKDKDIKNTISKDLSNYFTKSINYQNRTLNNIIQIANSINYVIYSDAIYLKKKFNQYAFTDPDKNLKYYLQLFYLVKMFKNANFETVIFADSNQFKNTQEGLILRFLMSTYGIKYNFIHFKYFIRKKNLNFILPLKLLVYRNKKFFYMKYTLKQIYEKNINDYFINFKILQNADKLAYIEKNLKLDFFKNKDIFEEDIDLLEKNKEVDSNKNGIPYIQTFIRNLNLKENEFEYLEKSKNINFY